MPELINLVVQNNIILFTFLAYLMYCMQLYNVGVFQLYKHWYLKAIQYTLETLDFDYIVLSFLQDFYNIYTQTFKKSIIKHTFEESGM